MTESNTLSPFLYPKSPVEPSVPRHHTIALFTQDLACDIPTAVSAYTVAFNFDQMGFDDYQSLYTMAETRLALGKYLNAAASRREQWLEQWRDGYLADDTDWWINDD